MELDGGRSSLVSDCASAEATGGDEWLEVLPSDLTGTIVAVFGGASGSGFAAAQRLTERGATIAVCDLDELDGRAAARRLGCGATSHPVDRRDPDPADWSLLGVVGTHGKIDIAINAGSAALWRALVPSARSEPEAIVVQGMCATLIHVITCEVGYLAHDELGSQTSGVIVNLVSSPDYRQIAAAAALNLGFVGVRLVDSRGKPCPALSAAQGDGA